MGFIGTPEEIAGVRKTLDAAGWTYVAAFVISLATFLYYLLPLLLGGRSRRLRLGEAAAPHPPRRPLRIPGI